MPKLFLSLLIMLVAFAGVAQAQPLALSYAKAQKLVEAGRQKQALALLESLLRKHPGHIPSHLLAAHLYFAQGQVAKAGVHFRALEPDSVPPRLAYEYGISMFIAKDCSSATPAFGRVPTHSAEAKIAPFYLGMCALKDHELEKATKWFNLASQLPPKLEVAKQKALKALKAELKAEPKGEAKPGEEGGEPARALPQSADPLVGPASQAPPADLQATQQTLQAPQQYYYVPPGGGLPATSTEQPYHYGSAPPLSLPVDPLYQPGSSGWTYSLIPTFLETYKQSDVDFFGYRNTNTTVTATDINLTGVANYLSYPKPYGQAYAKVTLTLEENWAKSSGSSVSYFSYNSDPSSVYGADVVTPPGGTQLIGLIATPEAGIKFDANLTGSLGLTFNDLLPSNIGATNTTTVVMPYLGMTYVTPQWNLALTLTYATIALANSLPPGPVTLVQDELGFEAAYVDPSANTFQGSVLILDSMDIKTWESFSAAFHFTYKSYTPTSGYQIVQDSTHIQFGVILTKKFGLGLSFAIDGEYALLENYKQFVSPTIVAPAGAPAGTVAPPTTTTGSTSVIASGNGNMERFQTWLNFAPVNWAFILLGMRYTSYSYSGIPETLLIQFEQVSPEAKATYYLQAGLTKTF